MKHELDTLLDINCLSEEQEKVIEKLVPHKVTLEGNGHWLTILGIEEGEVSGRQFFLDEGPELGTRGYKHLMYWLLYVNARNLTFDKSIQEVTAILNDKYMFFEKIIGFDVILVGNNKVKTEPGLHMSKNLYKAVMILKNDGLI